MKSSARTTKGFTLVELLVVIAIITILSSVVIASLISARERAANSRTISQNREFAQSFLLYSQDHNDTYPITSAGSAVGGFTYLCLGTECVFNNSTVDAPVSSAVHPYISDSANTAIKEYSFGTQEYRYKGTVFTCTQESVDGCVDGRIFYPYSGTTCPSNATLALTDSVNSLCTQDIESFLYKVGSQSGTDTDGDSVPDNIDNCISVANPSQADADYDGIGDARESYSCTGTPAACSTYGDAPTCSEHSGYCQWANYQPPTCYGNYNFNCSIHDNDNVSCGNAIGCSYDYDMSTCNNGQQVGSCDSMWNESQCLASPNCIYDMGTAGNCQLYGFMPSCSSFDESTCAAAGCSWTSS